MPEKQLLGRGGSAEGGLVEATDGNFYGAGWSNAVNISGSIYRLSGSTLTPAKPTYGEQAIGTTSPAKTFTLTNYEGITLTGISISTTGDYAISGTTCSTSLAVGAKCTIDATFTPTQTGTRTGQLSVSDSSITSPQVSMLSGVGVVAVLLAPSSATYSSYKVGTTSPAKTFSLTNHQSTTITGIAITTAGDFAVSSTTCSTTLAPATTCTIDVTFTPTQIGTRTGKLTVVDSGVNSPQVSTLQGTGG